MDLFVRCETRVKCIIKSEASNPRQLEVIIAAVKIMKANWP